MVAASPGIHGRSAFATVQGVRLHYVTAGEGDAVLLLHGNGENWFDWAWTLPTLARGRRVYALDLPGAGDSEAPAIDYAPETLTQFVIDFLDAVGVQAATLVGNSLGGTLALCAAIRRPDRVRALALLDSSSLGQEISPLLLPLSAAGLGEAFVWWSHTWLGAYQRAWARAFHHFAFLSQAPAAWIEEQQRLAQTPGCLNAELAASRRQAGPLGQRLVLLDQLPAIRCPTIIVWGAMDRTLPWTHAYAAVERLPRSTLRLIRDCGHMPHVECPEKTLQTLVPFLEATSETGS